MQTWVTLEQAAATLGVSARTVQRRLAAGDLQSRTADGGRREVLIDDTPRDTRPPAVGELGEVVLEQHDRALALAERSAHVGQLAVDRVANEAQAARRMVGIVGVALAVTVSAAGMGGIYAAFRIGGAEARLASSSGALTDATAERDRLAAELADAKADTDRQREQALAATAKAETMADALADLRSQLRDERARADDLAASAIEHARRRAGSVDRWVSEMADAIWVGALR